MKIYYVSRYVHKKDISFEEFTGGADNLQEYLIRGFKKYILGNHTPLNTNDFVSNPDITTLNNLDSDITHVLIDSSCCPSMREVVSIVSELSKKNIKMYMFMHSSILSCEDQRWEHNMTPTLYDLRDLGIYKKMADMGLNYLYASANIAYMSKALVGNGFLLPIKEYLSPNMNKDISTATRKVYNNKVLYVNAYYHPAAGIHAVINAIKNSKVGEFEWYLVGNIFNSDYTDQYDVEWPDRYKEILDREDVHAVGPQYGEDLVKYYNMCSFNLIPSICESYSFKALEAISYGLVNVTSTMNSYLPWVTHALKADPGNSVEEFGINILNCLRQPMLHPNVIIASINSIKYNTYINEFEVVNSALCYEYITKYFSMMANSLSDMLSDPKSKVLEKAFNSGYGRI